MELDIAHLGLVDDDALALDASAVALAALDHAEVDLEPYLAVLDRHAERVAELAPGGMPPEALAGVLKRVLWQERGFTGDVFRYDDPDNADLIRVIDRKRGLPVSLVILYVAAARRAGFQADALNTPGHVLARIGSGAESVVIDPFNEGRIVRPSDLGMLIAQVLGPSAVPSAEHLAPMANRAVLVRLLMNQAGRAEAAGNIVRALALYDRMSVVAPSYSHLWWERARLQLLNLDVAGARASLSALLETTRDPALRTHVSAALDALARRI
ncbi:MAG: transglutaminase-like domain-containing protein [Pseudomonadota bacterium]